MWEVTPARIWEGGKGGCTPGAKGGETKLGVVGEDYIKAGTQEG